MNGYKPVRCGGCDKQLAWVKGEVASGMLIQAKDGLLMNGEKIKHGAAMPQCPDCSDGLYIGRYPDSYVIEHDDGTYTGDLRKVLTEALQGENGPW